MMKLKSALLGLTMLAGVAAAAQATSPVVMLGKAEAARPVSFDVILPLRNKDRLESLLKALHDPASPSFHQWLSPAQFGLRFGPSAATIGTVTQALQARGFTVQAHTRTLHVAGDVTHAEQLFATNLRIARGSSGRTLVVSERALKMPAELASAGAKVVAFTGNELHSMAHVVSGPFKAGDNRFGNDGAYYFTDLKQAYEYPSVLVTVKNADGTRQPLDGTGVTLGVLITNDVQDSDIQLIFDHEFYSEISGKPTPTLFKRVLINGGAPYDFNASFEANLDVQEELTGAPGSHVILYNLPSLSDDDIIEGLSTIVDSNEADLVSASFGGCEALQTSNYINSTHELFQQGNAQGISFLTSSGDSAGKQCPNIAYLNGGAGRFLAGPSAFATDPNVTGVGGTNVVTVYNPPSLDSTYAGENAWVDPEIPYDPYGTGGTASGGVWGAGSGISRIYTKPDFQNLVDTTSTMRSTPDIGMQVGGCPGGIGKLNKAGNCDGGDNPNNGFGNTNRSAVVVANGGARYGLIGTSVSSPELAGATAMLIQTQGRMGNLNEYIYRLAADQAAGGRTTFHTNIPGTNGLIPSNVSPTYSVSVGVGTPIVRDFVGAFTAKRAGLPQTRSNP